MLTQLLPSDDPHYKRVMDFCKLIPENHSAITTQLKRLEKTFPQITPAICLVNTPEQILPNRDASGFFDDGLQSPKGQKDSVLSAWKKYAFRLESSMLTKSLTKGSKERLFLSKIIGFRRSLASSEKRAAPTRADCYVHNL